MASVERIRQHTICPCCENVLKKPRMLPCLHSFCSTCLRKVINEDEDVICPKCSENHGLVEQKDESSMPRDVLAESLIYMGTGQEKDETTCSSCENKTEQALDRCLDCREFLCSECSDVHRRLKQTRDHEIITLQEYDGIKENEEVVHRTLYCDAHPSEELRYFCEKCKQIVCRECTVVKHKSHKYMYMEESSTIKQVAQTLESLVLKTQSKISKLKRAIDDVNVTSDLITASIAGLKNSVRSTATEMVRHIRVAEEEMLTEIDRVQSRKFHGLNEQLRNFETNLEVFENGEFYTEHALKYLSGVELYLARDPISDRLKVLNKKRISHEPVEENNLKHVKESREGQKMVRSSLGYLEVNGNLVINGCVRDLNNLDLKYLDRNQVTTEPSQYLKGIAVDIRGPGGELLNPLRTERDNSGDYGADFQAERTGNHSVVVYLDGVPVQGSPLQVLIGEPASPNTSPSPYMSPLSFGDNGRKPGQLRDVHGIVLDSEGQIIVTDSNCHRVQMFDKSGRFLRMFGRLGTDKSQFNSPHGIAVTKQDHMVIADTGNCRIQIFDNNGKYLRNINCLDPNGESFCPYDVTVDDEGNIIALDREKGKVRIYKKDQIMLEFGDVGTGDCEFINPSYIAVNKNRHIIVSDMGNDRLQVLTSAGKLLFKFGQTGMANGEFRWPTGIAVKMNGDIVVADSCNNRIQTFRADGTFGSSRGPSECREDDVLKLPEGVAVDEHETIFVADWGHNRVQIL